MTTSTHALQEFCWFHDHPLSEDVIMFVIFRVVTFAFIFILAWAKQVRVSEVSTLENAYIT